ncbi:putative uncharacterized protein C3orf38-like [Penaeus vannamei]|uniref:Uncharacterized protein n=1 Tax=Penaeus vannamei TaxID=6689 RepID=A0A423TX68_PENVA|nr:putative uncharacterized protein C3orf38-like [Penaeus vannamei]
MLDKSKHASQVRRLLRILDADALKATVSTATKGKVEVTSEIAAIDVILKYTPDLEKLFSYQRITSDVLFKYLSQLQVKNKKIELTRRTKKHEMVSIIKGIWKKNAVESQTPKKNKKIFRSQVIFSRENPEPGCVTSISEHDHNILCIQYMADSLQDYSGSEISEVSSDYSDEDIGTTSSEGAYVFEELEEEYHGLMVVGPYMHKPDAVDVVKVVPNQPDMEWRRGRDPKRLNG